MHVAESVLGFLEGGHGLEGNAAGATIDLKHQRFAGAGADDLLHVREAVDRPPIDRSNHVARPEDGRPSPYRLMDKAVSALFLAHGGNRGLVGHACGIIVPEEFYISSEWNSTQLPSGVVTIVEAKELRTKPDRKHQDPHATPARNQEMPELVEEHHDGQYE